MNKEPEFDPELERDLRALKPAAADSRLLERLEEVLSKTAAAESTPAPPTEAWRQWLAPVAGAAAMIAALLVLPPERAPEPTPSAFTPAALVEALEEEPVDLKPVQVQNHVLGALEEGIVSTPNDQPFHKVRLRLLDSFTWEDDSGATRIKYTVPREEHFLIPATIY